MTNIGVKSVAVAARVVFNTFRVAGALVGAATRRLRNRGLDVWG